MNLLHHTNDSAVSKAQKKALKDFYSLKQERQEKLIEEFKHEKISSDILQTIYKKEGIEGTLIKTLFI